MSESPDYYRVGQRRIPLRRVPNAALFQPKPGVSLDDLEAKVRGAKAVTCDPCAVGGVVAYGQGSDVADLAKWAQVQTTRGVYTDPQGVELVLTDELAVGFHPGVSDPRRRALCQQHRINVLRVRDDYWIVQARDPAPDGALRAANALANEPEVEFAEPNALQLPKYEAVPTPPNPFFARQWHLWGNLGVDIRLLDAWEVTTGSPAVRVVIHDTGVDRTHPDLVPNLLPGWNFGEENEDVMPIAIPQAAHGTACAGLVAAAVPGPGVVGVAPGCKIVPLRVQRRIPWERLAATFDWAVQHGEVILGSWTVPESTLVTRAVARAAESGRHGLGTVCVFSCGNGATPQISFPSSLARAYPVLAVGASTNFGAKADYSNWGDGLDLLAPSSGGTLGLETTDIRGPLGYNSLPDGDYCRADDASNFGGTSAAAAIAAGVAALVLSANPQLSAAAVRDLLRSTAAKMDEAAARYGPGGWSPTHGYGRVDAARAVRAASNRVRV
ncbi:MAG: S8 family serine peptidase [Planctomycetes bacterium]|nr:S8 family serine peptidase [Planctomycetota bacterium]